jgi:DNA-binding transcriptional LysR family regulator
MKQLEFTTLKIFAAVAESGSMTSAAEKMHLTTAAVSKRIRDFEQSSGNQLFVRHARGMTPTTAGHALLAYAREILFTVDRMEAELRQIARGVVGTVRIAAAGVAVAHFLPDDLKSFGDRHPDIDIDLSEFTSNEVTAAVMEGRVEIGILFDKPISPDLLTFDYRRDRLCVVVPSGHALARRKRLRFVDALDYEFIAPLRHSSLMQTMLSHSSGRLKTRIHVRSDYALCRMVGAGLGIGICQAESAHGYRRPQEIRCITLDESWAVRQWLLSIRGSEATLSAVARLLLAHLQGAAAQHRKVQP